ncbi:hypothetical protein BDZ97DRAFT_2013608 [Flammula alnicola]|nr:hypothetical protein BDZ97DRAFT_2013608 [Flammula alnicola]
MAWLLWTSLHFLLSKSKFFHSDIADLMLEVFGSIVVCRTTPGESISERQAMEVQGIGNYSIEQKLKNMKRMVGNVSNQAHDHFPKSNILTTTSGHWHASMRMRHPGVPTGSVNVGGKTKINPADHKQKIRLQRGIENFEHTRHTRAYIRPKFGSSALFLNMGGKPLRSHGFRESTAEDNTGGRENSSGHG